MPRPWLTIITVVYNAKSALRETIATIALCLGEGIDYLVIDGGSSDGTIDVIRENSDVITDWVSERDAGIYDAMNKAINRARGEWLLFINAGDHLMMDAGAVGAALKKLPGRTQVALGIARVIDPVSHGVFDKPGKIGGKKDFYFHMPACHQAIFYRRRDMVEYDTGYRVIADKVHLFMVYQSAGPAAIVHIPLLISSYMLGGFSEKNRRLYHREEARFFRNALGRGAGFEQLAYGYISLKHLIWRALKALRAAAPVENGPC